MPMNHAFNWSLKMTDSVMQRHNPIANSFNYEAGLLMKAIEKMWLKTNDAKYFDYIKENIDQLVDQDGNMARFRLETYNIDYVNCGKVLFRLYEETGEQPYLKAMQTLRLQLKDHPRTSEGGFWHKQRYPHQMWLDGIYMGAPFYAEYGLTFNEPEVLDDVAKQIEIITKHARDPKTGLFYHAWDESRKQKWADPVTGCSPHFWGRAVGWFMMALVDLLELFPDTHPKKGMINDVLKGLTEALIKVQDPANGLWYQVLDLRVQEGNYPEASASCMNVYAIVKGVRHGWLDHSYLAFAQKGYEGIIRDFVTVDEHDMVNLNQVVHVSGLGGDPYRDGSYEYYISEKAGPNDYKGVGPFIMCGLEFEAISSAN